MIFGDDHPILISESKDNYVPWPSVKPPESRDNLFRSYLYKQINAQYLHSTANPENPIPDDIESEYFVQFCKGVEIKDKELNAAILRNRYPLNSTRAITVYNKSGDSNKQFRRCSSITRPVYLQTTQFG